VIFASGNAFQNPFVAIKAANLISCRKLEKMEILNESVECI